MSDNVVSLAGEAIDQEHAQHVRLIEALLFAAEEPLDDRALRTRLPEPADLAAILSDLARLY
ncbi:MAG: SMC-Scp complex subunit ScpB, partial [Inquilinus sp.]|nr:SMC-Scp complex subunit ScpB [Inquilinus sp.]